MEDGPGPRGCPHVGLANPRQVATPILALYFGRLGAKALATHGHHLDHADEGGLDASIPRGC